MWLLNLFSMPTLGTLEPPRPLIMTGPLVHSYPRSNITTWRNSVLNYVLKISGHFGWIRNVHIAVIGRKRLGFFFQIFAPNFFLFFLVWMHLAFLVLKIFPKRCNLHFLMFLPNFFYTFFSLYLHFENLTTLHHSTNSWIHPWFEIEKLPRRPCTSTELLSHFYVSLFLLNQ